MATKFRELNPPPMMDALDACAQRPEVRMPLSGGRTERTVDSYAMKYTLTLLALAFSIALSSVDAVAQETSRPSAALSTESTATPVNRDNDRPNYSWVGLLGLAGLAGLLRRRQDEQANHVTGKVRHA